MKIKYPDIYNRYRKLKGPIRAVKVPKSRRNANIESSATPGLETPKSGGEGGTPASAGQHDGSQYTHEHDQHEVQHAGVHGEHAHEQQHDHHQQHAHAHQHDQHQHFTQHQDLSLDVDGMGDMSSLQPDNVGVGVGVGVDDYNVDVGEGEHDINEMNLEEQEMLAQFANQSAPSDLAQALLRLPSGPHPHGEDAARLEEVLKMARMAAGENLGGEMEGGVKGENAWDSIDGL